MSSLLRFDYHEASNNCIFYFKHILTSVLCKQSFRDSSETGSSCAQAVRQCIYTPKGYEYYFIPYMLIRRYVTSYMTYAKSMPSFKGYVVCPLIEIYKRLTSIKFNVIELMVFLFSLVCNRISNIDINVHNYEQPLVN